MGSTTGSDGMPRYQIRLPNGQVLALKPANLTPIATPDDGGGGGGFGGMPDLGAMLGQMPPWLREKIQRGEQPSVNDLKRLLGIEVPTPVLGGLAVAVALLWWKLGLVRALVVGAPLGFAVLVGFGPFSRAGGGVGGLKAGAGGVRDRVQAVARDKAGYDLTTFQVSDPAPFTPALPPPPLLSISASLSLSVSFTRRLGCVRLTHSGWAAGGQAGIVLAAAALAAAAVLAQAARGAALPAAAAAGGGGYGGHESEDDYFSGGPSAPPPPFGKQLQDAYDSVRDSAPRAPPTRLARQYKPSPTTSGMQQ